MSSLSSDLFTPFSVVGPIKKSNLSSFFLVLFTCCCWPIGLCHLEQFPCSNWQSVQSCCIWNTSHHLSSLQATDLLFLFLWQNSFPLYAHLLCNYCTWLSVSCHLGLDRRSHSSGPGCYSPDFSSFLLAHMHTVACYHLLLVIHPFSLVLIPLWLQVGDT